MPDRKVCCRAAVGFGKKCNRRKDSQGSKDHQDDHRNKNDLIPAFSGDLKLLFGGSKDGPDFSIWCCVLQWSYLRSEERRVGKWCIYLGGLWMSGERMRG